MEIVAERGGMEAYLKRPQAIRPGTRAYVEPSIKSSLSAITFFQNLLAVARSLSLRQVDPSKRNRLALNDPSNQRTINGVWEKPVICR
jgi:hypothetical protein